MSSDGSSRWAARLVVSAFLSVGLLVLGQLVREHRRHRRCASALVPDYAAAGAGAERVADAVCEVLDEEVLRPGRAVTGGRDLVARLEPALVGDLLWLRRVVSDRSPEACAAYWTGDDPDAETRALPLLGDAELRRYARTAGAIERASRRYTYEHLLPAEARARFDALLESVTAARPDASAAIDRAALDAASACLATRAVLSAIEALAPGEREESARAWLMIERE